jgi:hypothetical protein
MITESTQKGKTFTMENLNKKQHSDIEKTSRRAMIATGGALIGALAGSVATAKEALRPPPDNSTLSFYSVTDFGATGKRSDNATGAFRSAIAACATNGGGKVHVPPGEFTVGTVQLRDNVTLEISGGATLFLSQDRNDFVRGGRAMIFADNVKNAAVTGRGTLNGLAQYEFLEMSGEDGRITKEIQLARDAGVDMRRYYRSQKAMNTYMFIINDATDFLLEGVTIINSPLWNVRLNDCNRVHVRGVHIYSDLEKGVNADGIDICSCSNVTISDSVIITADDSICVKSVSRNDKPANPCRNITVTNCVLTSSSTPLKIGTETVETEISNVLFTNCVIRNSNKGFGIDVLDGATVSDVVFSNLTIETSRRHWNWWGDAEMCKIVLSKRRPSSKVGTIRNVVIDNIIANVRGTSKIMGYEDQPLENIRISNVHMRMHPEDYKDKRATDALKIEGVRGLNLRDVTIAWSEDETEPKWGSALSLKNVSEFVIDSFSARQGILQSQAPVISMENVSAGLVRDSRAMEGTHSFVYLSGDHSGDITMRNNRIDKGAKAIAFESSSLKKAVQIK